MNASPPRVGVVIRTKDRPLFVVRALRSVLAQTSASWHMVLVNDGGDAAALKPALQAPDLAAAPTQARLTVMNLPSSIGRSAAFNRGAKALATEFVCCLDDDDSWEPDFLASLLALHDATKALAPDLGGVAALVTAVREDIVPGPGGDSIVKLGEDDLPHSFKRTDFFLNPIAYATYRHDLYPVQWMLNREAVLAVGGFPEDFDVMEDRAFMTRFVQRWRVAILDRKLAYHHRRVRRTGDTQQSVTLNTLDNPSYDWRLYADLAKGKVSGNGADPGDLTRAAAATVIKELNDETSALWHKINGEAMALRARIEALDARITGAPDPKIVAAPLAARVWSLWPTIGAGDVGYPLVAGTGFLDRLSLSMPQTQPGTMLHASVAQGRMVVQIPRTLDWAALEISLAGLADRQGGLRCELILSAEDGYLFETALSLSMRDRLGRRSHAFDESHVHSCPPGGTVLVTRDFTAAQLARSDTPKLSIALPRQAHDFRLCCHDLVVSRI